MSFIGFDSSFEEAKIVVFGAPFDGTTSYRPGTRFAYKRMQEESYQIETYSPYLDKDLEDYQIHDFSDLEFPFGNTQKVLAIIEKQYDMFLASNKLPIMVGGEHLVTFPAIKSLAKKYKDLSVFHFDAHTDLRDDYLGETLSHATVMRRVCDIILDKHLFQFGIRSGTKEEFEFAKKHTYLNMFDCKGLEEAIKLSKGAPVYLSIDLDVLDPSILSATGTVETGGIDFMQLHTATRKIIKSLNIVGADIVELSPPLDFNGTSVALACKLLREIVLMLSKK